VSAVLGSPVVGVDPVRGGFSPGVAVIVRSARDRLFVKAASSIPNAFTVRLYRDEAARYPLLPHGIRRPAMRAHLEVAGWTVLCFDVVPAALPGQPWHPADLAAIVDLLCGHAQQHPGPGLPSARQQFADELRGWERIADRGIGGWWRPSLRKLVELERQWHEVAEGTGLVHGDVRADNVLLGAAGPVLVDWAYACRGNPLLDVVHLLLDARTSGAPGIVLRTNGPRANLDAVLDVARVQLGTTNHDITVLVATFTGWYTELCHRPPLPGLPRLRGYQGELAQVGAQWLAGRLPP
jgi:Phosphotransferase enzyme family